MRILLVHPPVGVNVVGAGILFLGEPLALETIAATVPEHEVRILDMRVENEWECLGREIAEFDPDMVGTTALTTETYQARRVLERAKSQKPSLFSVVGGQHATLEPGDFDKPYIDFIVIGEGVDTFPELVQACLNKREFGNILGLACRRGNELVINSPRPPCTNLDSVPFPARHLTSRYRESYFRGTWRPYACMVTSRGCPFRCNFCSVWRSEQGKYRTRSAENVLQELKLIKEDKVGISDDNFLHDTKRAEEIYNLIKKEGIEKKYKLIGRSDTIIRRPDLMEKWREIGLEIMVVGVESFRDEDLKGYNKKTTVEKNNEAIRILQANEVTVSAHFVIHQDYEEKDFQALGDYVEDMDLKQPVFCVLTPLPGTGLHEETKDLLLTRDYEKFDFMHSVLPTKINLDVFHEHLLNLYKRCYLMKGNPSLSAFLSTDIIKQGFKKFYGSEEEEASVLQNI